jgi:hypothetical protein
MNHLQTMARVITPFYWSIDSLLEKYKETSKISLLRDELDVHRSVLVAHLATENDTDDNLVGFVKERQREPYKEVYKGYLDGVAMPIFSQDDNSTIQTISEQEAIMDILGFIDTLYARVKLPE